MVRLLFIIVFVHLFIACVGQEVVSDNKMILNASFSKDSVFIGDSLKITLYYKNNSAYTLKLYLEGRIIIRHYHPDLFITYDTTERIAYILREYSNPDSIVWLKPGEEIQSTFDIEAKESFFYEGKNIVTVCYRNIWDKPTKNKKRKKTKQEPIWLLWSPPIKIIVN
ncbi:hypothetical protein AGMMS50262_24190 [Bacteroidia bacterium]|nr:hypothetical protein AGMMS50262_24190 [Bacteroidia bacterium]